MFLHDIHDLCETRSIVNFLYITASCHFIHVLCLIWLQIYNRLQCRHIVMIISVFRLSFALCHKHIAFVSHSHYNYLILNRAMCYISFIVLTMLHCRPGDNLLMLPCIPPMQTCDNQLYASLIVSTQHTVRGFLRGNPYKSLSDIFYHSAMLSLIDTWYSGLIFNLIVLHLYSNKGISLMVTHFYFTVQVHHHVIVLRSSQQPMDSSYCVAFRCHCLALCTLVYLEIIFILVNFPLAVWR